MGLVLPQSFHAATFMFLSVTKSREIYVNQIIHVEIRTRAKGEKRAQEQTNNPRYDEEKTKSSSKNVMMQKKTFLYCSWEEEENLLFYRVVL